MKKNQDEHSRGKEIANQYFTYIEQHVTDVIEGIAPDFKEINEIAGDLFISHQHLTDIIQKENGHHPCYFYDLAIIERAKEMLQKNEKSVAEIARILTYEPSNFSKFFKKFVGKTPGAFKKAHLESTSV